MSTTAKADSDMEKAFCKIDTNGDGRISATELESLLHTLGSDASTEEVSRMMSEIDKDGDGYIDLKEFAEFHCGSEGIAGDGDGDMRAAFAVYDKDKNGLISACELQAVLRSLGENVSIEDCATMIGSVDTDGDGHVNFDEFKKMMR